MRRDRLVPVFRTESICPACFAKLPAELLARGETVFMRKVCPEHGEFQVPVWRGLPEYKTWSRPKVAFHAADSATEAKNGCPFDCGLCPEHRQQTCTALIEVTSRCNLRCAFCFADSGGASGGDPGVSDIRTCYEALLGRGYMSNVQLSGGEPTVRDDLPEIVALGRSMGFGFIQINTNGLRLATDPLYVEQLRDAGVSSVFLQFDGTDDRIYQTLRGADLFDAKARAIRNCEQVGLGVVLVPTLVPGVNLDNVGHVIRFALENLPTVRGVHFQPVTYVGRCPGTASGEDRLTLPEVIRSIELQTGGLIRIENFRPPGCENALCSFHGDFVVMPDEQLIALTSGQDGQCSCATEKAEAGAARTRQCVAEHWSAVDLRTPTRSDGDFPMGQWDVILERARTHRLSISGMAFQDAWNLDLERLKDCCIHIVERDGRVIPFCAYNVTSLAGRALYRRH